MTSNIFDENFQELIEILNELEVEYILVGGYSVILHGYNRSTGDLDLWVNPTGDNYHLLNQAFSKFGLPTTEFTLEKFLNIDQHDVFTFGRAPLAVDFMTKVKGLEFQSAYVNSIWSEVDEGIKVRILSKTDLLTAKKAAGRYKDLDDIENLSRE